MNYIKIALATVLIFFYNTPLIRVCRHAKTSFVAGVISERGITRNANKILDLIDSIVYRAITE